MAAEPRDGGFEKEKEEEEAAAERAELLRDRFRLSVISIANAEGFDSPFSTLSLFVFFSSKSFFLISLRAAEKVVMGISEPVVACIADLAFKYTGLISKTLTLVLVVSLAMLLIFVLFGKTEQLAKDVELFAQHAGRKSVNMEDVILSAHRNDHLAGLLRSFSQELKGKEPQTERKRKKSSKSDDKALAS
ncbi:Centromere protein S [Ananas comosus]|uniref:Centromere protein S n=1 Tax=Ananas comosus TaxID=4615 RepID=A0A199VHH8_ANACO|nr:Centromere protein S [Ananas comosus]